MSVEFIFRLVGMVLFGILGVYLGERIANLSDPNNLLYYQILIGLVGALAGLILTPFLTTRPVKSLRVILSRVSVQTLLGGLLGLMAGLILAALLAFPISMLPEPFGNILPFIGALLFSYLGVMVFIMRQNEILSLFRINIPSSKSASETPPSETTRTILLDTSVIIDGRIADIARTGFLMGSLLIPRFVLNELQFIADSPDSLRRQRGRRGMEVLAQLQKNATLPVRISDIDVEGVREVDDKLVILARQLRAPILTNDYNLNRVAELQGVAVLNVNELANAVKSILLPGEGLNVNIIQEGKEAGQGVGYLDDGTMVVVEDGRDHINRNVFVIVTKVLQTAAGRMIFARLAEKHEIEEMNR
ncbi:MAG: PIN/TRAM domain-containing protein [Anaerolineales bacterium]